MRLKKVIELIPAFIISIFSITLFAALPNIMAAEMNSCISYNSQVNEISISCKNVQFKDIANSLGGDKSILYQEPSNALEKNWILKAAITVNKDATLNIDSDDVTWLKIVPGSAKPNPIKVDGSLNIDSKNNIMESTNK